jgi:uncharacterized repeat protein (TIGR01451 family)
VILTKDPYQIPVDWDFNTVFGALLRLIVMTCIILCGVAPAHAQLRSLQNPSFELNDPLGPGAPNFEIITNGSVVGWDSTTGEIELWDSNFNGVPAFNGNVFAEMNANVNGTLYQNICLINGEPIGWTFAHRARAGGAATQTARFQVANSGGTVLQTLATQASTTANQIWNVNTGNTTYNGASGLQRVQFNTPDTGSFGNFLDGIQMTLRPFIQLSVATGTGVESVPSANIPTLVITGLVTTSFTVNVTVTGGTATLGTDYTTPGGGASFAVTVPAGTYNNTAIPLGITITDDSALEPSETIALSLGTGSNYTVGHTVTCGSAARTTTTYTITDNDSRVTLRKQWTNAIVGDDATLTLSRSAVVIDTLNSDAGAAGELDTDATPTPAVIGETLTLAETLAGSNVGSYAATLGCTGAVDSNLANGLTIAAGETNIVCTYTNSRNTTLSMVKTSSIAADGVSASNPKAVPASTVRYCILVTNLGPGTTTSVVAIDNVPALVTYTSASLRSGPSCATATTVEDDNAAGADESDPFGISISGTTITGLTASLAAGSSFAMVFNATVN